MDAPHEVFRRQAVRLEEEHVLRQIPPLLGRVAQEQQGLPRRGIGGSEALQQRALLAARQARRRHHDPRSEARRVAPPLREADRRDHLVSEAAQSMGDRPAAHGLRIDDEDGRTRHWVFSQSLQNT
jgi:hypothetical protein